MTVNKLVSICWAQSPREAGAELKQQMRAVRRTAALPALGCNRLFLLMAEIPSKSGHGDLVPN